MGPQTCRIHQISEPRTHLSAKVLDCGCLVRPQIHHAHRLEVVAIAAGSSNLALNLDNEFRKRWGWCHGSERRCRGPTAAWPGPCSANQVRFRGGAAHRDKFHHQQVRHRQHACSQGWCSSCGLGGSAPFRLGPADRQAHASTQSHIQTPLTGSQVNSMFRSCASCPGPHSTRLSIVPGSIWEGCQLALPRPFWAAQSHGAVCAIPRRGKCPTSHASQAGLPLLSPSTRKSHHTQLGLGPRSGEPPPSQTHALAYPRGCPNSRVRLGTSFLLTRFHSFPLRASCRIESVSPLTGLERGQRWQHVHTPLYSFLRGTTVRDPVIDTCPWTRDGMVSD